MDTELKFAVEDVEMAFKQLEFAIKLMCHCELRHLDQKKFDSDITILLEEENIGFHDGSFRSYEDLIEASQINVGISFGASAITLDALLEQAGIERNSKSEDPNDELRTLIYMVRCAFAHNIAKPCWEVKAKYRRKIKLILCGREYSLDFSALNGKDFEYSHIGGFANWYRIKERAIQMINEN